MEKKNPYEVSKEVLDNNHDYVRNFIQGSFDKNNGTSVTKRNEHSKINEKYTGRGSTNYENNNFFG